MQQLRASVLVLLVLWAAACLPSQCSARLIINATTAASSLAGIQTLMTLPREQLLVGVADSDWLAVLDKALAVTQAQDTLDSLFSLAMQTAAEALDGPKDVILQGLGLDNSFVLKYPAAIPNLTALFPAPFNVTGLPTLPWLNSSITLKGLPRYDFLNWSLSLLTPQIPILSSKLILSNKFTEASLLLNSSATKS